MRLRKLIFPFLILISLISLSSCDNPFTDNTISDIVLDDLSINSSSNITDESWNNMKSKYDSYFDDYTTYYGYSMLSKVTATNGYDYGSEFKKIYDSFYTDSYNFLFSRRDLKSIDDKYTIISIYDCGNISPHGIETNYIALEYETVWLTFIEENPLFYFLYTDYGYLPVEKNNETIYYFCLLCSPEYKLASERYTINETLSFSLEDIGSNYSNYMTYKELTSTYTEEYYKAKFAHDFLCERLDYAYTDSQKTIASDAASAHNILALIEDNKGVCETFAKLYLLISRMIDFDAIICVGTSGTTGHAWNYAKVNGVWYGIDVTWDDSNTVSTINYDYFLVSNKIMKEGHTAYGHSELSVKYQVELPSISSKSFDTARDIKEIVGNRPTGGFFTGGFFPW